MLCLKGERHTQNTDKRSEPHNQCIPLALAASMVATLTGVKEEEDKKKSHQRKLQTVK